MTVTESIHRRESCRAYADRPVEREKLTECLECARLAPSACNSQPWRFVAVTNADLLARLRPLLQRLGMNRFVDGCRCLVVVCEEPATLSAKLGGDLNRQAFAPIDVGIAAAHFCLAATERGLSTCILGWLQKDKIRALLGLSAASQPRLVIAVGYAATDALREKKRKPFGEVVQFIE